MKLLCHFPLLFLVFSGPSFKGGASVSARLCSLNTIYA